MNEDNDIFIGESDMPGQKVDFQTVILISMIRCNKLLSEINNIPPGLHSMMASLEDDDLRPNRLNYVYAVDAIGITLDHYLSEDETALQELANIQNKEMDLVEKAKLKHRVLIRVMAKNGLLPLQIL